MTAKEIFEQIKLKRSFLCVGLDTDVAKLPVSIKNKPDAMFEFNKAIIDATIKYTVAYKPNLAFYEAEGLKGLGALEKTVKYIRSNYPNIFLIADAKRGDIGNTSGLYAKAFFETMDFDAVTLSPYMGKDTVQPFLAYKNRWSILLALTSNASANDFQLLKEESGEAFYQKVLTTSKEWGCTDNLMYVVGATKAEMLQSIRKLVPDHFLLIPGVGEQGGSLEDVARYGLNKQVGLLVNSSRAIIFADNSENFAKVAGEKAKEMQSQMNRLLNNL